MSLTPTTVAAAAASSSAATVATPSLCNPPPAACRTAVRWRRRGWGRRRERGGGPGSTAAAWTAALTDQRVWPRATRKRGPVVGAGVGAEGNAPGPSVRRSPGRCCSEARLTVAWTVVMAMAMAAMIPGTSVMRVRVCLRVLGLMVYLFWCIFVVVFIVVFVRRGAGNVPSVPPGSAAEPPLRRLRAPWTLPFCLCLIARRLGDAPLHLTRLFIFRSREADFVNLLPVRQPSCHEPRPPTVTSARRRGQCLAQREGGATTKPAPSWWTPARRLPAPAARGTLWNSRLPTPARARSASEWCA